VSQRPRRAFVTATVGAASRVGFYGCASGSGRLVRCAFVGAGKPPESAKVACPACGLEHRAAPMWRPPSEVDGDRTAEVLIGAHPADGNPSDQERDDG